MATTPPSSAQSNRSAPASQTRSVEPARAESRTVPALFVSDIHFDPFHDPGKVKELAAAPVVQWHSIFASSPSPNQQQAFEALQRSCHAKGIDTSFALFESSLQAMRARQSDAKFMVVSGDLMAHAFTCKYAALFPGAPAQDYEAFTLKTLSYVAVQLRTSFPSMPIYLALGNNDSGCGDYQLDAQSDWLAQAGKIFAEDLPASEQQRAAKEFATGGYYSATMAAPMKDTRLIVINDLFLSPRYRTCADKADSAPANEQTDWLARQLQQARQSGQRVWVMGHIPPGIDAYSTLTKFRNVCGGQDPVMFLSSGKMVDLLVEYADTVRLGIFGHTHMDEVRLLEPDGEAKPAEGRRVAVKMIPSISPVDGNNPSFMIARVNPSSATIEDYTVIAASNQTGAGTNWSSEYDYDQTYRETEFTTAALTQLIDKFQSDHSANLAISESYLQNYFVGDRAAELSPFWPQYACSLNHSTAKGYASCVCATGK